MRQRTGNELKVARTVYGVVVTAIAAGVVTLAAVVVAGPFYLGFYAAYCAVMGV